MPDLAIDYSYSHPDPTATAAAGYKAVLRYLSNDPSKDLGLAERDACFAAGLDIGLIWETTAQRALDGFQAGVDDAHKANYLADTLGVPPVGVAVFYAVDFDANPANLEPYFQGINSTGQRTVGVYGSAKVVEHLVGANLALKCWQTEAWSGSYVSPQAHLYQRVTPTLPQIAGTVPGNYDENVILLTDWGQWLAVPVPPPPSPPAPTPSPPSADPLEVAIMAFGPFSQSHTNPKVTKKIQGLLNAFGYPLTVDGSWGPHTNDAVLAFQTNAHVTADGWVGSITAGHLVHD